MKNKLIGFILILSLVLASLPFSTKKVEAASLTHISDTQTNQTAGALSSHTITFVTPSGINAASTTTLNFDNGTVISGITSADIALSVNGVPGTTTFGSAGPTTWGFAATASTVTITAPTTGTPATASSSIVIKIGTAAGGTNRITNGALFTTDLTIGGTMADSALIQLFVVFNSIVNITASVAPTISFAISSNTLQFGTLSTTLPRYATTTSGGSPSDTVAHTITVSTNSTSGYSITFQGSTLTSGTSTISAITGSPATSSPGTPQFGLYSDISGGTGASVATNYATPSSFFFGATSSTTDLLGSGTAPTTTVTYSLHYLANISATTTAGSYSANITYIATPQF